MVWAFCDGSKEYVIAAMCEYGAEVLPLSIAHRVFLMMTDTIVRYGMRPSDDACV